MRQWGQRALEHFAVEGRRAGAARGAVIEALDAEDCCISAADIVIDVGISSAATYRVLDLLVEHGLVARISPGMGTDYFEALREVPHHHLACEACGALVPIVNAALDQAIDIVEAESPVRVSPRSALLKGYCEDCWG